MSGRPRIRRSSRPRRGGGSCARGLSPRPRSVLEPQRRGSYRRMRRADFGEKHCGFVPGFSTRAWLRVFTPDALPRSSLRQRHRRTRSHASLTPMVFTTRKPKLGPPLVVKHDDVCLGLVGKAGTWWPLRVHGSGHDPTVDVIFFGDSKTGRLARNKLRPFSDLREIPSRFIPKRCGVHAHAYANVHAHAYATRADRVPRMSAPPHTAALRTKTPSRRRTSGSRPPGPRTSRHRMTSIRPPRCRDSSL